MFHQSRLEILGGSSLFFEAPLLSDLIQYLEINLKRVVFGMVKITLLIIENCEG